MCFWFFFDFRVPIWEFRLQHLVYPAVCVCVCVCVRACVSDRACCSVSSSRALCIFSGPLDGAADIPKGDGKNVTGNVTAISRPCLSKGHFHRRPTNTSGNALKPKGTSTALNCSLSLIHSLSLSLSLSLTVSDRTSTRRHS